MLRRLALMSTALIGFACAPTSRVLPFVPLFPQEFPSWTEVVMQDPFPVAVNDPKNILAAAYIDYMRGKRLPSVVPMMERLVSMGNGAAFALMQNAQDPDADIRLKCSIVLGQLRNAAAAETLLALLDDPSEDVAVVACRALSLLYEPWIAPKLFSLFVGLQRHPSMRVRVEAARATIKLGFPHAIPFLLTVLQENTRLAAPYGDIKDWDAREDWDWEKWIAAQTLKELSGIDSGFDAHQGIPQMEASILLWLQWWREASLNFTTPLEIRNDLRLRKIEENLQQLTASSNTEDAMQASVLLKFLHSVPYG